MFLNFSLPEMMCHAASCMTLLRAAGIRQTKLYAAICNSIEQQDTLVKKMRIFSDNKKYGLGTVRKNLMTRLEMTKDDILFISAPLEVERNSFSWLNELMADGFIADEPINSLVCVLFNGYIPEEVIDFFQIIVPNSEICSFVDTPWQGVGLQKMIASKRAEWLHLCTILQERRYKEFADISIGSDQELLYATAGIKAFFEEKEAFLAEVCYVVDAKLQLSEKAKDTSDLPDLFAETIYKYVDLVGTMLEYSGNMNAEIHVTEGQVVYVDDNYYYFSEPVMNEITRCMREFATSTEIKRSLAQAGYLETQGQNRNYYTQKLKVAGRRERFYWLKRTYIDRAGEATLHVTCELRKGEMTR